MSSVARRPPLDFGGWSQSVFFQNVLLVPFAITARRATILRREEAEREVASREEKRREDGFPVNRPRRLARAQTRPTAFRVRRRHYHPRYGGGLFFFMRRRKRRFCVRACKARSKIVRETSVCLCRLIELETSSQKSSKKREFWMRLESASLIRRRKRRLSSDVCPPVVVSKRPDDDDDDQ